MSRADRRKRRAAERHETKCRARAKRRAEGLLQDEWFCRLLAAQKGCSVAAAKMRLIAVIKSVFTRTK